MASAERGKRTCDRTKSSQGIIVAIAEATTKRWPATSNGKRHGGVRERPRDGGMCASKSSLITPLSAWLFQLIVTPRGVLLSFYRIVLPTSCQLHLSGYTEGCIVEFEETARDVAKFFNEPPPCDCIPTEVNN